MSYLFGAIIVFSACWFLAVVVHPAAGLLCTDSGSSGNCTIASGGYCVKEAGIIGSLTIAKKYCSKNCTEAHVTFLGTGGGTWCCNDKDLCNSAHTVLVWAKNPTAIVTCVSTIGLLFYALLTRPTQ